MLRPPAFQISADVPHPALQLPQPPRQLRLCRLAAAHQLVGRRAQPRGRVLAARAERALERRRVRGRLGLGLLQPRAKRLQRGRHLARHVLLVVPRAVRGRRRRGLERGSELGDLARRVAGRRLLARTHVLLERAQLRRRALRAPQSCIGRLGRGAAGGVDAGPQRAGRVGQRVGRGRRVLVQRLCQRVKLARELLPVSGHLLAQRCDLAVGRL